MNSIESEQAVLAVLLMNGELITSCKLHRDEFSAATLSAIFDAMRQCEKNGTLIDIITVAECLERSNTLDAVGGMKFLGELCEGYAGAFQNFTAYEANVRKCARSRKAKQIALNLQMRIDIDQDDQAVSCAIRDLMALDVEQKNFDWHIKDAVREGIKQVEMAMNAGGMTGITSGLKELDDCIGGFHESDLIVIAARPAMGKTAFLLSAAHSANVPCGIISSEQSSEQMALRLISIGGSVHSQNVRSATLSEGEWTRFGCAAQNLASRQIWINDQPAIDISALVRQARIWKHNNKIQALYVDYIQKIRGQNQKAPRWEQITDIVQQLKNLARELRIPIISLAQVKRDVDSRADKLPRMGDISDASEIEKEADLIMTLYRDVQESPGVAQILIEKNRHGDVGNINCQYVGKYFQFKDREGYRFS